MSVKDRPDTVAIGIPDRSSWNGAVDPSQASVTVDPVVPLTRRFVGTADVLGVVVVAVVTGVDTEVGGDVGGDVVPALVGSGSPIRAVSTGVVTPVPRMEYRYGVFGSKPMSVKRLPTSVAIR